MPLSSKKVASFATWKYASICRKKSNDIFSCGSNLAYTANRHLKKLIELVNSEKTYLSPTRLKLITMPYGVSTRKRNIRNWKTSYKTPNKIITSNMINE